VAVLSHLPLEAQIRRCCKEFGLNCADHNDDLYVLTLGVGPTAPLVRTLLDLQQARSQSFVLGLRRTTELVQERVVNSDLDSSDPMMLAQGIIGVLNLVRGQGVLAKAAIDLGIVRTLLWRSPWGLRATQEG